MEDEEENIDKCNIDGSKESIYSESDIFQISKILITGPLNPNMPFIVIKELALECGILVSLDKLENNPLYYAKVYAKLAKFYPPLICEIENNDDFEKACNFVNPLVDWEKKDLTVAMNYLKSFYHTYKSPKQIYDCDLNTTGLQTPNNLYLINACVLYGCTRYFQIPLHLNISYNDLKNIVQRIIKTHHPCKILNIQILEYYSDLDEKQEPVLEKEELIQTKTIIGSPTDNEVVQESASEDEEEDKEEDIQEEEVKVKEDTEDATEEVTEEATEENKFDYFEQFDSIQRIGDLFEDITYLQNNFYPKSNEQAIVAGALVFLVDLTKCENPLKEYKRIFHSRPMYQDKWRSYQEKNINILDLNIYFNPYLPVKLYHPELLNKHLELFTYPSYDYIGMEPYEILQELYLEEHFHIGWFPLIRNKETPILLDEINHLENNEIVCFGSIFENYLYATTWKELTELFKQTKLFTNPFSKNILFHKDKISRLYKLGKWILHPPFDDKYLFENYTESQKYDIENCLEIIDNIIFESRLESDGFLKYKQAFNSSPQESKILFKKAIEKLFEVSMTMRGWNGDYDYLFPISNVPYSDPLQTEKKTIEKIFELDQVNQDLEGIFYSFPLILWKNEFIKSVLDEQGLTIGQRINMVKNGENSEISSCIRLTSNVLGSTYCFYCKLFDLETKFDIEDLTPIS
jgi:hypothetical protein